MTPDQAIAREVAHIMRRNPGFEPLASIVQHINGKSIEWPVEWVARLNRQMKEATNGKR